MQSLRKNHENKSAAALLKDERVLRAQQQSSEGKQKREGVEHRITELEQ